MKKVFQRIYSDLFLPSRLEEYKNLLIEALENGYRIVSIEQFYDVIVNKNIENQNYLVLRHDIDTDASTAKLMFEVEKQLNVNASYYFRLSTINIPLMKEIHQFGSEVSYHYEEVASYAKQYKIKNPNQIYDNLTKIQSLFSKNLEALRNATGIPMEIVASHGDFVNRYLKITNCVILREAEFRDKNNIKLEVYDDSMMKYVTSRHSDCGYPVFWKPNSPKEAIKNHSPVIYILTHPRHWKANIKENIKDDYIRLIEGIKYRN
ncbi:hypothetical protein [Tepidanaerobacter syntrophicus]|uniref:Polysaccharide deacetylase n=1 Tax=Tepidanaerobacter syntrophicus TaxID=224999 RepID=A0A0U9HKG3_9FIRM|nr:hypothetical protein [Tepidanaerobacter syntrophicus]GAQ24559.1 hypothetical protein TSYNT_5406 [Tepidanaerobacter syntrophicus]GLI19865.1 hypothetical protein TSYNTROPHJE_16780 [Tepidanaerobacter syntrophicus]